MAIDDRTTNRSYQLPNFANLLADDVARLRAALQSIDADIFARYTKAEVDALVTGLIQGAPGALDTLNELAAALGDDPNFAATITNLLAQKANSADVYTKTQSDARYVQGQTQAEMVFIATANQSVFTLSTPVINKPSALVTVDGVVQPTSEYSLNQAGTSLTLSEGVPVGTVVRVLALGVASAGAPADDSVTEPKLRDEAVTTPKLHPAVRVPVAAVFYLAASTAPAGFLIADGSTVPNGVGTVQGVTANFSALFAALGTFYGGAGKLPDLRGEFIRGWDGGRGVDPGRAFGSAQSDENKIHSHGVTDPGHNHALNYLVPVNTGDTDRGGSPSNFSLDSQPVQPSTGSATTGISIQASGGNEARPRNIALLPCIKY